jgi:lipoprotein NlpD
MLRLPVRSAPTLPGARGNDTRARAPEAARAQVGLRVGVLVALVSLLAVGCATSRQPAPVEDRAPVSRPAAPSPATTTPLPPGTITTPPVATPTAPGADTAAKPGAENAGKPGYYTIKPGDTLIRVGLETGQNARDIARWNGIDNPNSLEVGQVLRVTPPGTDPAATASRGVSTARVDARPLDSRPITPNAPGTAPSTGAPATPTPPVAVAPLPPVAVAPPAVTTPSPAPGASAARDPDDEVNWAWPAAGAVIGGFDEAKSKGLSISGKAGDPVLAAADGRVVYAGSGLRGYGNLVIVKHNATYLTAYAHNQSLLVKEDQVVRRGQKIAEMGSSDAERVQLHFEIRRLGRPIDPARLLPTR